METREDGGDDLMKAYWVCTSLATFLIEIDENGIITKTAPIAWKWKGKYLDDFLAHWHPMKLVEI